MTSRSQIWIKRNNIARGIDRQADGGTEGQTQVIAYIKTDAWTDRLTCGQTGRHTHTHRHTHRQREKETCKRIQTDRHTYRGRH